MMVVIGFLLKFILAEKVNDIKQNLSFNV